MKHSFLIIALLMLPLCAEFAFDRNRHISTRLYFAAYGGVFALLGAARSFEIPFVTRHSWTLLQLYGAAMFIVGTTLIIYHAQRSIKPPDTTSN